MQLMSIREGAGALYQMPLDEARQVLAPWSWKYGCSHVARRGPATRMARDRHGRLASGPAATVSAFQL
jgi:hypothetical protein